MDTNRIKLLVVAAMEEELAPLIRLFSATVPTVKKRTRVQIDHERGSCSFFVTGVGRKNVSRAKVALQEYASGADMVIVTGVCGALDREARIGDTFFCAEALAEKKPPLEMPEVPLAPLAFATTPRRGAFLTHDYFAGYAEKKKLRAAFPHALCVDMETYFIVEILKESAVPFLVIKSVSDTASARLPEQDFLARHYRSFSARSFLSVGMRQPLQSFLLLRLKRGFARAVIANSLCVKKILDNLYDDRNP
jgi:adenosylhomocysteine nucleosidase